MKAILISSRDVSQNKNEERLFGALARPIPDGAVFRIPSSSDSSALNSPEVVVEGLNFANGFYIDEVNNKFYLSETLGNRVLTYDLNLSVGSLSNPETLVKLPSPDNMQLNHDGLLWVASPLSNQIYSVNTPDGTADVVFDAQTNLGLAELEANLRAQGLKQAQAQQAQAISQFGALSGLEQAQATQNLALLGQAGGVQSGLASLQPQLVAGSIGDLSTIGQQSQALNQAALDAQAAANREAAYETQQRLGFFGSQISPLMGAFGAQTQFATTQQTPPSTLQTILGTGLGIAGLARAFG